MVVAQLEERSLATPEVRGSKPVIGKLYITRYENIVKETGNGPIFKNMYWQQHLLQSIAKAPLPKMNFQLVYYRTR